MITARELRLLRVVQILRGRPSGRRFHAGRTHKASSAEAILRHCLRQRGWSKAYRAGELTGTQHLELLEDVRQYGRAWLRHEAEAFVRHHMDAGAGPANRDGTEVHTVLHRSLASGLASHFRRFFGRAKSFVRELIVAGTQALLGPAPLTGEELEIADREAVKQEAFFDKFYNELEFWGAPSPKEIPAPKPPPGILEPQPVAPKMTPPQFVARVEKYADSTHHAAQRANRAAAIRQGVFLFEMLILGDPVTAHCSECPPDAAMGWVPIGTLRNIGDRECRQHCLCHFVFTDRPGGAPHIQGNRGPMLSPRLPDARPESEDGGTYPVARPADVRPEPEDGGSYPVAGAPT